MATFTLKLKNLVRVLSVKLTRRNLIKAGAISIAAAPLAKFSAFGASELIQPPTLRSVNGVLNVTLEAKPTMLPFNGGKRWALTYNGTFPGPTLIAKPGDTINVTLKNSTNMMTNLHTHGPHLPPTGNSDNPFIMIAPGDSFKYSFKIRKDQEPGTFWYHPHHHEFVAKQLSAGLAGAIIIEGDSDKQLANTTDRVLVFADPRIGTNDSVMNTSMMDQMHGRTGDYLLINGQLKPSINAKKGRAEHWRIVNASPSLFLNLSIDNANIFVIGTDGGRVNPYFVNTLRITPGQRYEILIYPKSSGTLNVRNDGEVVATLSTDGTKATAPTFAPIPALKASITKSLKIAQGGGGMMGGMSFTFNGETFNPNKVNMKAKLGTVEEWVITNTSHMAHPFHIHAWAFQVVDRGDGKPDPGWKDTVEIPVGAKVRIRLNFADFGGKTVYHCHILDHEDTGMMGIVEVK